MQAAEFVQLLRAVASRTRAMDHSEPLQAVVPEVHQSVANNYSRQVDETGTVWPPRKDSLPHPLLRLTLAMNDASTGGPGSITRVTEAELAMGIDKQVVPYYPTHHAGSPSRNIPKRRFYYLNTEERPKVLFAFGDSARLQFRSQVLRLP